MTTSQESNSLHATTDDERSHEQRENASHDLIVGVRFELSPRPPFAHAYPPDTHVYVVLAAAMDHFGVQPDPNTHYYLTAHRERQPEGRTLGEVAGQHDDFEFRLVKELVQGSS